MPKTTKKTTRVELMRTRSGLTFDAVVLRRDLASASNRDLADLLLSLAGHLINEGLPASSLVAQEAARRLKR